MYFLVKINVTIRRKSEIVYVKQFIRKSEPDVTSYRYLQQLYNY